MFNVRFTLIELIRQIIAFFIVFVSVLVFLYVQNVSVEKHLWYFLYFRKEDFLQRVAKFAKTANISPVR